MGEESGMDERWPRKAALDGRYRKASRRDVGVELQEETVTVDRVTDRPSAVIRPPRRVWFDVSYRHRDGDWVGSTICCPIEERELFYEILGEWLNSFRWAKVGDHQLKGDGLPETRLTFCPCVCGVKRQNES